MMAVETREQALDLVAALFTRAGARLPAESLRHLSHPFPQAASRDLPEREAA